MKKVMAVVMVAVVACGISGCGVGTLYNMAVTKDPEACNVFQPGKTTASEVEVQIGKPVSMKVGGEGSKIAKYRSGYFVATVNYDSSDVLKSYECEKN